MATTTTALNRRLTRLEWQRRVASQPSDAGAVVIGPPSAEYARTVLTFLLEVARPIREAGGPLTPRVQELLRLAEAADAPPSRKEYRSDGHHPARRYDQEDERPQTTHGTKRST